MIESRRSARSSGMIGIAGAGAWGTAMANVAASKGHEVILWMRDPRQVAALSATGTNERFLPGIRLHERIRYTSNLSALGPCSFVLLATPAQTTREMTAALAGVLPGETPLVLCAKGIERDTNTFLSETVRDIRPSAPVAVLSGPSFARDVARGLPTAVTLACKQPFLAADLAATLSSPTFRVYYCTDVRGVEIGGAVKNVLAIACGAVVGRGLGESAKAALIARGSAELLRFAQAYGGKAETLMGLSGLGDLVLTCSSEQSRNFSFGLRLSWGAGANQASGTTLVEGAATAGAVMALAHAKRVEMPITEAIMKVLDGCLSIDQAVGTLMARPIRPEHESIRLDSPVILPTAAQVLSSASSN